MSVILAIETATSSCSVALRINDEVTERSKVGNNVHSQVLLEMVQDLLSQAQISAQALDAVAVGQGPGSFTGLRIGVGVGQGLAFGAKCPMIGVSSLDALALQALSDGVVIAAIDARMGEVYWCEYQKKGSHIIRLQELNVTSPAEVCVSNELETSISLVGNAWATYQDDFVALNPANVLLQELVVVYPSAGALLLLAEEKYLRRDWVSAAAFAPIYVRDDVAKKSTKQLPGRRPS